MTSLALAQAMPQKVTLAPVEQRVVSRTQPLVASVEPVTRSLLAAEEAGLVAERYFDEGRSIDRGLELVKLDTDVLHSQLTAARAARASAAAMVERANADAANAADELTRMTGLFKTGAGSEKEIRDAVTADRVFKAMAVVRTAEMAEKAAEIARIELLIRKSRVVAPLDGVVVKRHVEVGQWIKQGEPVAEVVQLDPLFVRVQVPEELMGNVRKGDSALVTFDALRGRPPVAATVDQILPDADAASRTFTVKLLLPNPGHRILPGFFARAQLTQTSDAQRVLVPSDAIVSQGERQHVVLFKDGRAALVPVKHAGSEGGRTIVTGDLKPGDLVVTRGNESVFPGQQLIPLNMPPAPSTRPATQPSSTPAAGGR